MAQLTLGYLLSEDPARCLRFYCRRCRRPAVDRPLGELCVALGENRTLASIKGKCTWCNRSDQVEVNVWKDTWSGPRG
jgi:hypothetical protein